MLQFGPGLMHPMPQDDCNMTGAIKAWKDFGVPPHPHPPTHSPWSPFYTC